ncbi:hypothetical protein ACFPOE_11255 [Caenimonas terrae]|uniref:Uncharacterized protein n=1 Tax=Caenimonas terrae TaxID=696074 RepID=A0ABW0NG74_9BURK
MPVDAETLTDYLPYYLTREEREGLLKELAEWPRQISYYLSGLEDEVLQGDAWTSLPIRHSETGELARVTGIILSNSCSIDPSNDRAMPAKVVVAPLVELDRYREVLIAAGFAPDAITGRIDAIKEQRVHNIFFLPAGAQLSTDHLAYLDDLYSFPAAKLTGPERSNRKLATLATTGFYLFIFKLSIHFCRFSENVSRQPRPV